MYRYLWLALGLVVLISAATDSSFRNEQKKNPRVKTAYEEKWQGLKAEITALKLDPAKLQIFIRGFKKEKQLEVWARQANGQYILLKTYSFCALSGSLGPKRCEGDMQVPEGFYTVSIFNPNSNYYLSLGIDYPNKSDRLLGKKGSLGNAIMIHGHCVTIGCIPITDEYIKELYIFAVESKANGYDVPVHLFPSRLSAEGMNKLEKDYAANPKLINFWQNLQPGYAYFEKYKKMPAISVGKDGRYVVGK